MSIEVMRQALDALESVYGRGKRCDAAITALRQAIAQAEQAQPVAWMWEVVINDVESCHVTQCDPPEYATKRTPLYTSPPQRKPLTDEEIAKIASTPCAVVGSYVHTFARALEAAHGIIKGEV